MEYTINDDNGDGNNNVKDNDDNSGKGKKTISIDFEQPFERISLIEGIEDVVDLQFRNQLINQMLN